MDLTTIKENVVTWVNSNKVAAGLIGIGIAGAIIYFVRSNSQAASTKPALLNGPGNRKRKRKKAQKIAMLGLK